MFLKFHILLFTVLLFSNQTRSQNIQKDTQRQSVKDDGTNYYQSDEINRLDILEAMDFAGIKVNKFKLGSFDTTYNITFVIEEFVDSKLKKIDTIFSRDNLYGFYIGEKRYNDYIDQIKIFSKQKNSICTGKIETYVGSDGFKLVGDTSVKNRFYNWRSFIDPTWKINKKIALMIYASSWTDKKYKIQRFCGTMNLKEGDNATNELLKESPHYYLFSYKVTK